MATSPPLCGGEEDGDLEEVRHADGAPSRANIVLPNTYFVCSAEPRVSGGDPCGDPSPC